MRQGYLIGVIGLFLVVVTASAQEGAWQRAMDAGRHAIKQRQYDKAERFFRAALTAVDGEAGDEPRMSTSLLSLATLHQARGKYATADRLYQRALNLREQSLGVGHPEVAEVLDAYADLFRQQYPWRSRLPWSTAARMSTRAQHIRQEVEAGSGENRSLDEWPKAEAEVFDDGNA